MVLNILLVLCLTLITIGSLYAVFSRQLFHAVLGFAVAMLFTGGIYFLLNQSFLALIHILVYVGGVSVLALFAYITSISVEEVEESKKPFNLQGILGAIIAFFMVLFAGNSLISGFSLKDYGEVSAFESGLVLLSERLFDFEFVSVLLLVSLLSALVIGVGRKKND